MWQNVKKAEPLSTSCDNNYLVLSGQYDEFENGFIQLIDINTGETIWDFINNTKIPVAINFSHDSKNLVFTGTIYNEWITNQSSFTDYTSFIESWDTQSITPVNVVYGNDCMFTDVIFTNDGNSIIAGDTNGDIQFFTFPELKLYKILEGHKNNITSLALSYDGKFLISGSLDSTTRIWNLTTDYSVSLTGEGDDWIVFTDDGYYDCSKNGAGFVAIVDKMNVFNIDQFAAKYNRPDIILDRMELSNKETINHYYNHYLKRLCKLNISGEELSGELHVPASAITSSEIDGKFITLDIELIDNLYDLKYYNIYQNDVPLYGIYGKNITGNNLHLNETVELISGNNKIEVSCINVNGAESFRAVTNVNFEDEVKGDLYYLGFGISEYADNSLNLKYSAKDAEDLKNVFINMKDYYNNVYIKTITNNQLTVQNIINSGEFIRNASVDDTFVLYISGHGVHDTDPESTYYYLTYNADINDLKNTCADFELIEELLYKCAACNKLFLMDTCESGEIDPEITESFFTLSESNEFIPRTTKGLAVTGIENRSDLRTFLINTDRYIYNDLIRRSGAIVFSSCMGGEFSYETDSIENGFFTESIIESLFSSAADKDNNNIISIDEMKLYVTQDVISASSDLQHPTVDRDNIYIDFGFPLLSE